MSSMGSINLIKTKTSSSPRLDTLEAILKKVSIASLVLLICSSVTVGGIFFYLRNQKDQLEGSKTTLAQTISRNTIKEGLLFSIKQRVGIVDKIVGSQQSISPLFDTLGVVVSPTQLVSLTFDDSSEAVLTIHVTSIDEAVSIVDLLLQAVENKQAKTPKLLSLTLARDGSIEVSLSFVAVL